MDYNCISLSGGSIKGIAYLGVLKALEDYKIMDNIDTIAGVSMGAFFATLLAIGFEYKDSHKIFNISFKHNDISLDNFFTRYGFIEGNEFEKFYRDAISIKCDPDITFKEMYDLTKKKLIISAACLNTEKIEYFDYIKTPDLKVIDAILMSTSIPFIFVSKKMNGKYYVDGGLYESIPTKCFDENDKVLRMLLCDKTYFDETIYDIEGIEDYIYKIVNYISKKTWKYNSLDKHTMKIFTPILNLVDFNLDKKTRLEIFSCGYKTAKIFFEELKKKIDL